MGAPSNEGIGRLKVEILFFHSSFEQQSIVETFSIQGNEMCSEVHKILFIKGTT